MQVRSVVDDVILQCCGPRELVMDQPPSAVEHILQSFGELELPVHLKKCKSFASSRALAEELESRWSLPPDGRVDSTRNLGTDANLGTLRRVGITRARWSKSAWSSGRLVHLRAAGADVTWIQRGGPTASALWGVCVM